MSTEDTHTVNMVDHARRMLELKRRIEALNRMQKQFYE